MDFDGVIIDGMNEYWNSSRKAYFKLYSHENAFISLSNEVPESFRLLRPWVNHGWEMVLIAAELSQPNSFLRKEGFELFAQNYEKRCTEALRSYKWEPKDLQKALDSVREEAIANDIKGWLKSHKAFPGVVKRLKQLESEQLEMVVLTTKGSTFTHEILQYLGIKPKLIYGHESGSKKDVLIQISQQYNVKGFIEDRRATLETVLQDPQLSSLTCYLANWGYIKPDDLKELPSGIHILEPKIFSKSFSAWP